MKSTAHVLGSCCLLAIGALVTVGCGGPPKVNSANGERLPANGAPGTAPASELPVKTIARDDWDKAMKDRLAPACDSREGTRTADARNLEGAGKVIGTWTELRAAKGKSRTEEGKKIGGKPEPTRAVTSVGMTCAAGASSIQVNGVQYPFDVAWVVTGEGSGPTLNGVDDAGNYVMIQALSYKDQRVVFTKVFVPSDSHNDTDDTVIVSSLAGYLPENPDPPVVRAVGDRRNPQLETFISAKGATQGISLQVPQQDALGQARYLGVAKFAVGK